MKPESSKSAQPKSQQEAPSSEVKLHWTQHLAQTAMAICLGIMALSVFINVVLRYGFGSGLPVTEELSRLLFVWMVFIGAAAAYPFGEHMAFTGLAQILKKHHFVFMTLTAVIRLLVITACVMLAWGAWQQVKVGVDSHSVVLGYPASLLPLPAFLSAAAIAIMALIELIKGKPLHLAHSADAE